MNWKLLSPAFAFYLTCLLDDAAAVRFPVRGRAGGFGGAPLAGRGVSSLGRRASITSTPDLTNQGNLQYQTNITLNGQQFQVLIDTGSSDLYVVGTVPGAKDTGKTGEVTYAIGATKGPIKTATLEFEGFTIQNQAFIEQSVDKDHTEGSGIIGLGPGSASNVDDEISGSAGDAPLDRIFRQNTTTPNYITILLGRAGDPSDTFVGDFTIGEVVDPFGNVTAQPKLDADLSRSHWVAQMDKNGIIGPDGQRINTTKHATGNKLNVMFDSGFTFPQVSTNIANNIYGRVPGAKLANVTGGSAPMWTLPCTTELNISFVFHGVEYPVHPLDTVTDALHGPDDDSGTPTCVGAFQPITIAHDGFDIILGMSFLRNAYILINFGDFVDGALAKVGDPYIQLLPLTDPAEAHRDFVQARLGGVDDAGSLHLLPVIPDTSSGDDDSDDDSGNGEDWVHKYLPYIIAGSVTAGVLVLALIVGASWRASRRTRYRRLHDPAPSGLRPTPAQRY